MIQGCQLLLFPHSKSQSESVEKALKSVQSPRCQRSYGGSYTSSVGVSSPAGTCCQSKNVGRQWQNCSPSSAMSNPSASHPKSVSAEGIAARGEVHFLLKCPHIQFSATAKILPCTRHFPFKHKVQNMHSMQIISLEALPPTAN